MYLFSLFVELIPFFFLNNFQFSSSEKNILNTFFFMMMMP